MHVKLKSDWFGMRAGGIYEIGQGVGEILVMRNFAEPANPPDSPETKPTQKRKRRARSHNASDSATGQT